LTKIAYIKLRMFREQWRWSYSFR